MAFRANQQLRDDIWDYRYKSAAPTAAAPENVVSLAAPSAPKNDGVTALDLVHQAAEIFKGMENRARETEARAQAVCESLAEKLRLAEKQRDAAEHARCEVVNELNGKLQDVSRALQQAQSRIMDAEERTVAAEYRGQAAEAQLHRANQELAAVEEAIRKRLL
jgi:chromosome segregation ATPase